MGSNLMRRRITVVILKVGGGSKLLKVSLPALPFFLTRALTNVG
jgi:hypothetical protein